jgi:acetolactate synthase-1/2/3 large subunit
MPPKFLQWFKKAFYLASSGRPGPVVIDIPKDCTNPIDKFPYEYPEKVKLTLV